MDFVMLKGGAASFLQARLNDSWPSGGKDLKVKLYTNTIALVNTLEMSDFTEVIAESGYEEKTLTCGEWTVGGDPAEARYLPQAFVFTGTLTDSLTIKGYVVTDADDVALWVYEFDSAFTPGDGLVLGVYPKINLSKKTPAGSQRLFDAGALSFLNARLNDVWPEYGKDLTLDAIGVSDSMAIEFMTDTLPPSFFVAYGDPGPVSFTLSCGGWTVDATPSASYTEQSYAFGENCVTDPINGYVGGYRVSEYLGDPLFAMAFASQAWQPEAYNTLYLTPVITLSDGTPV